MVKTYSKKGIALIAAALLMLLSVFQTSDQVKAAPDEDKKSSSEDTRTEDSEAEDDTPEEDTSEEGTSEEGTSEETAFMEEFDPSGTYHASLGLQTATTLWIERFGYYAENPGGAYCPYGEENWDKLTRNYNEEIDSEGMENKVLVPGEFTDVELKGNGTYTVKLEHADFEKETTLSQLQIATDLPLDASVQISDIQVTINNINVVHFDEAIYEEEENYLTGGKVILLFNHWRDELKNVLAGLGCSENSPNGWEFLTGGDEESILVTFTISGFDYDYEEENTGIPEETMEPEPTEDTTEIGKMIGADSPNNPAKENERGGISVAALVGDIFVIAGIIIAVLVIRKRERKQ